MGQNLLRYDLYCCIFFYRNNNAVSLEDGAKGQTVFGTLKFCIHNFSKLIWKSLIVAHLPLFIYFICSSLRWKKPRPLQPFCRIQWRTWLLLGVKARSSTLENCNLLWLHCYVDWSLFRYILWTKTCSIWKLINLPHQTNPYAYKKTKIFPTFPTITYNTPVDSLNQHMFCDLHRIARSRQKNGLLSLLATLPKLFNVF
jgi:hypothetical protein